MGQYTLQLVGASTYTWDGSTRIQPSLSINWENEYNTRLVPAVISAQMEIWHLKNFVFRDATPGNNTSDVESLAAILRGKSTQVSSVVLLYNGTPVRTLSGDQIMVRGASMHGGPGSLVSHWEGDLVIAARKLLGDGSDIVMLDQSLSTKPNSEGLIVQIYSGKIEVLPGKDLATKIAALVPASLGSNYIMEENGPDGYFAMEIENEPTNTVARFRQTQREIGVMLPSGATSWSQASAQRDTGEGRMTTTTARAGGTTLAQALSAAQSIRPGTGVAVLAQTLDQERLHVAVEYVQRAPVPRVVGAYNQPNLVNYRRDVTITGGGQSRTFEPIPGYEPFVLLEPLEPVTVVERILVGATNVGALIDCPIPDYLFNVKSLGGSIALQGKLCSDGVPRRPDVGETRDADLWVREVVRVYMTPKAADVNFTALFTKLKNPPTWKAASDFEQRTA